MTALFARPRPGEDETAQPVPQLGTAGLIGELLAEITAELRQIDAGDVARYIPQLASGCPSDLACTCCARRGHRRARCAAATGLTWCAASGRGRSTSSAG